MPYVFSPPDSKKYAQVFETNANESGISTLWFFFTPCVSVLKAEHARCVLRHSVERRNFQMFSRHFKRSLGQDSIVCIDGGSQWRHHRNLIKVAFTGNAVSNMASKVWKVANMFSQSILRECGTQGGTYGANGLDIFKWATIDIFGAVALGYKFGCVDSLDLPPLATSFNITVEDSNSRITVKNILNPLVQLYCFPTERNRRYHEHSKITKDLLRGICKERMETITKNIASRDQGQVSPEARKKSCSHISEDDDLLSILLKSQCGPNGEHDESYEDLIEMLITMFFAGYDTSSIALTFVMYCLSLHKEVQTECAKEAYAATTQMNTDGSLNENPTQWEDRLVYCWAVVMETLRLHPPVFTNVRNLAKDLHLEDSTIPSGSRVYIPIQQIHTDERNFARAKEFLPERWARRDEVTNRWVKRDHLTEPQSLENHPTYIPPANPNNFFTFSDGARNCVGRRLAIQESTMLLACIVRDLVIDTTPGFVMQKRKKFAMAPPTEMPLIFQERNWS